MRGRAIVGFFVLLAGGWNPANAGGIGDDAGEGTDTIFFGAVKDNRGAAVAGARVNVKFKNMTFVTTTDVTGNIELQPGVEMIMPGDNTKMTVHLIQPVAMEEGLRFAIREGGRTVGAGAVTKILT